MKEVAFDLSEALDMLQRTPAAIGHLLRDTSDVWHTTNEGSDTWSAFEVVGHLVHGEETDWIPRARIVLEQGEARPFDPFDRDAHLDRFGDWTLADLLDRFAELRRANVEVVRGWCLDDARLSSTGQHPELGIVSLRQLLAAWVVHDLNHLGQMARVMAKRYTDAVGPWREYLSILSLRR